ncbi:MAG: TonB-dependent receptor [Parasphingorhabdus sp.]|nr:TonB-dependent receptor [Parasphingorhabdus sp.]
MKIRALLIASTALSIFATPAFAQDDTAAAADDSADTIVVTGVARGQNRLDASVSTTSIGEAQILQSAPRSAAELLRSIPGIRAESSGGEGNANINVRGLPVSTGGAKFLQLQEDGLPILEFGDIIFGNADIFTRVDSSISRVESIRGGSASTFTSNSPGGIINFITKDGSQEGGSFAVTSGIDYRNYRVDAEVGGPIGDTTKYHLGGFYRIGSGARQAGYDAERGGQIRANLTQELGAFGSIMLEAKYLNDRAISYLPSPVQVTGTDASPNYVAIPNLSPNNQSIHGRNLSQYFNLDRNNLRTRDDVANGMHPEVLALGAKADFDLSSNIKFTNHFRYSDIKGSFTSPFPSGVDNAQAVADSIGGPGSTLFFATGPNAGQQITNPASLSGNGLLIPIVMFNVDLNSLDNLTNDARLNANFDVGGGTVNLTGGFYYSKQDISTAWRWTAHVIEANGDNANLIDIRNAAGELQTDNGTVGYGATFFGGCCRRVYDLQYETKAPFFNFGYEAGPLSIDASVRLDYGNVRGSAISDGPTTTVDVNGDGTIQVPETKTTVINFANTQNIDYKYNYTSYSVGATYRIVDDASIFARYSRGARANADRLIFGPAINATGGIASEDAVVDVVKQAEGGVKYNGGPLQLYLTGFYSNTEETNFDFGLGFFSNKYRSYGLEAEGSARFGFFNLAATGTYTNAKITSSSLSPANVGNKPRRQAEFVFQVTPSIELDQFSVGANIIGTTSSFTQDSNQLKLPGFTQVNAFASVRPFDNVEFIVNANNLFDVAGYTEAEEGSIPANGYIRARSINGRTISGTVRFTF